MPEMEERKGGEEAEGEKERKKITSVTERNRIQRRKGWPVGRFTR